MVRDPAVVLVEPRAATGPGLVLDAQQAQALAPQAGAQLLIGPAGSGKSTVLVEIVNRRLQQDGPAAVLGLAPTQAAARRWRAALSTWTASAPPTITTLHSLALERVRADAAARLVEPPLLLSAADQLAVVRDVVVGHEGHWPAELGQALQTRHFAERVRDFINRAALAGWTPQSLGSAARGPAAWPVLSEVWQRYRKVLALAGAIDYAELLERATHVVSHTGTGYRCMAVDGYHELDVAQIRLLRAIRQPGCRLLAAADPDQLTDRFRGAAADAPARFDRDFPDAAPPIVLRGSYRFGRAVEQVRTRLAAALPMAGLPATAVREHRAERTAGPACSVDVLRYDSSAAEAAAICGIIRRFVGGTAGPEGPRWADVAVLVRSAAQAEVLEQALVSAAIPVDRADGGQWLADQPVVVLLEAGLLLAAAWAGSPVGPPDPARLVDLLTSGMAGAEPHQVRRLLLRLRRDETAAAAAGGGPPAGSAALLAAAVADPARLEHLDPRQYPAVPAVVALNRRVRGAADIIAGGGSAGEALWALWSDRPAGPGSWARGLRAVALGGGPGAGAANRDLDAALALFAEAGRSQARGGGQQVLDFLAALPGLRMPGDRFGASAAGGNAVCLLTAHRAKDRQWPFVVVAGVQEGVWPSDAGGLGMLGEELLLDTTTSPVAARETHVADERRILLLAATRASQHLLITCAEAGERDPGGPQPSRFIAELGVALQQGQQAGGPRPGHVGVVADLRRAAAVGDEAVAGAAVGWLAHLHGDPDFPLAPSARWWSLGERTEGPTPLSDPGAPVSLTVTGLTELTACPWRWFVTRMLQAGQPSDVSAGIGRLVHRIHEAWANTEIERDIAEAERIVDQVWDALAFDADWHAQRRRREVMDCLLRLLQWQQANGDRIAFAERSFEVELGLCDGDRVLLRGKADLGVAQADGSLAVLDVKTAKSSPTRAEVQRHVQLAGYQAAVAHGGLADSAAPAGAGLLMASIPEGAAGAGPKVLWQEPLDLRDPQSGAWFADALAAAVRRIRLERFPAVESAACRSCPVTALCPAKNPAQEVGA